MHDASQSALRLDDEGTGGAVPYDAHAGGAVVNATVERGALFEILEQSAPGGGGAQGRVGGNDNRDVVRAHALTTLGVLAAVMPRGGGGKTHRASPEFRWDVIFSGGGRNGRKNGIAISSEVDGSG